MPDKSGVEASALPEIEQQAEQQYPTRHARTCANCGRPFVPVASAPGQRFHSGKCRSEWHAKRQRQARELLDRIESREIEASAVDEQESSREVP